MTPTAKPRRPLWSLFLWALLAASAYDGAMLLGSPSRWVSSPSYYAVRAIGVRPIGCICLAVVIGVAAHLNHPDKERLQKALYAGFAYNVFWLAALFASWLSVGIHGITGPSKAAFFAACYLILGKRVDDRQE
jgi:hypothetical protein